MPFGVFLAALGLFLGFTAATVAIAYAAVRAHFDDIPVSRSSAVGLSFIVATGFAVGWLTLGTFGYAIGQTLGNQNLGGLIGSLVGIGCWLFTTLVYGWRVTRGLAQVQVAMRQSLTPDGNRRMVRLRVLSAVIFIMLVVVVAAVMLATMSRTAAP